MKVLDPKRLNLTSAPSDPVHGCTPPPPRCHPVSDMPRASASFHQPPHRYRRRTIHRGPWTGPWSRSPRVHDVLTDPVPEVVRSFRDESETEVTHHVHQRAGGNLAIRHQRGLGRSTFPDRNSIAPLSTPDPMSIHRTTSRSRRYRCHRSSTGGCRPSSRCDCPSHDRTNPGRLRRPDRLRYSGNGW